MQPLDGVVFKISFVSSSTFFKRTTDPRIDHQFLLHLGVQADAAWREAVLELDKEPSAPMPFWVSQGIYWTLFK